MHRGILSRWFLSFDIFMHREAHACLFFSDELRGSAKPFGNSSPETIEEARLLAHGPSITSEPRGESRRAMANVVTDERATNMGITMSF